MHQKKKRRLPEGLWLPTMFVMCATITNANFHHLCSSKWRWEGGLKRKLLHGLLHHGLHRGRAECGMGAVLIKITRPGDVNLALQDKCFPPTSAF